MTVLWEQRVGAALFSHHPASLEARVLAGALVARTRMARWGTLEWVDWYKNERSIPPAAGCSR